MFPLCFLWENKRNTHWSTNIAGWNIPHFSIGNTSSIRVHFPINEQTGTSSFRNPTTQLLSPATSLEPACLIQPLVTWGPWGEGMFYLFHLKEMMHLGVVNGNQCMMYDV